MAKLMIVDFNNILYKAYFASNKLLGATTHVFLMSLKKYIEKHAPTHIICAMDTRKELLARRHIFPGYKMNRKADKAVLDEEKKLTTALLPLMNIAMVKSIEWEADDVIATLAYRLKSKFTEIVVISNDKDLYQLVPLVSVDNGTVVCKTAEDVYRLKELFPAQIVDFLALMGDNADCIPGCPGIGDSKARHIIKTHGTLDAYYKYALSHKMMKFLEHWDTVKLSKQLATLNVNAPLVNYLNQAEVFSRLIEFKIDENVITKLERDGMVKAARDYKSLSDALFAMRGV